MMIYLKMKILKKFYQNLLASLLHSFRDYMSNNQSIQNQSILMKLIWTYKKLWGSLTKIKLTRRMIKNKILIVNAVDSIQFSHKKKLNLNKTKLKMKIKCLQLALIFPQWYQTFLRVLSIKMRVQLVLTWAACRCTSNNSNSRIIRVNN
jgi:hypothetical protein